MELISGISKIIVSSLVIVAVFCGKIDLAMDGILLLVFIMALEINSKLDKKG